MQPAAKTACSLSEPSRRWLCSSRLSAKLRLENNAFLTGELAASLSVGTSLLSTSELSSIDLKTGAAAGRAAVAEGWAWWEMMQSAVVQQKTPLLPPLWKMLYDGRQMVADWDDGNPIQRVYRCVILVLACQLRQDKWSSEMRYKHISRCLESFQVID